MAKHPNARPHQYTDPDKLPFRTTPDGKVRKPHETKEQYQAGLFPPRYEKVMLASTSLDGVKLAQATLPEAPNAQDLAETEEVQITQAIRDLATQLNNHPVRIYNWVRNNIQFIPSYGSIQGSEMTLQNKRGNAFDTASLLIALYRAAGIPARYVYGTIDVPVDKAMNWVGGVTKPEAAQSLLGQGGIPNVGLASGGAVKTIRMEHVWVEASVDYVPSRGAVNKNPDTWVPVDASFKQYQFCRSIRFARAWPNYRRVQPIRSIGRKAGCGGERKRLADALPSLRMTLDRLAEPAARGDPQSPLRWSCKSILTGSAIGAAFCRKDWRYKHASI